MEDKLKFYKFSTVENMMLNLMAEGEEAVLSEIEAISCPINRFGARQIFFIAKERIKKNEYDRKNL